VRRALPETERFARARAIGRVATSRASDLFRGPLRRRSIGLLGVSFLRPIALIAVATWPFYHMVETLSLSPGLASLVYLVGGGIGQVGHPLGARLSNRWGRRPTSLAGSIAAVATGVLFFWVAPGPAVLPQLMALMALNQAATAAFSVSDRLIAVELFPTPLRATFAGASALMLAGAAVASQFGLSLLSRPLGGLVPAITWLSLATFLPATAVFLLAVPETRGLSLEQASLEEESAA
jgi:MFS family permease